ncbi:hypothetical protein NHQ30_010886 [Ciborinia camelliae]|nr:hypothetical protein NHQ30_010886 [Ciborinia camelliae]
MTRLMRDVKDQMIEEAQEKREETENVLDDIKSSGENFECPYKNCEKAKCTKQCFVKGHFNWCLEHSAPSSKDVHGTYHVTEIKNTKINWQITERRNVVEKPKCVLVGEHDNENPSCNIVESDFTGLGDRHEFEMDRWMAEQMGKSSP